MPYDYEYSSLELESDEFEADFEDMEADSGEFEDPEFEFETGVRPKRILRPPRIGTTVRFEWRTGNSSSRRKRSWTRKVFGVDTRKVVMDTTVIPFRLIGHLAVGFMSADKTRCLNDASGTLIGRRHILTAGHVFDSATLSGKVFKVVVAMPGSTVPMRRKTNGCRSVRRR